MPASPRAAPPTRPAGPTPPSGSRSPLLAEPHWSAITPVRPLRLWRLIEVKDDQGLAASRLTIDERVLHYLAGVSYLDTRLRPLLRVHAPPAAMAEGHARVVEAAVQAIGARRCHAGAAAPGRRRRRPTGRGRRDRPPLRPAAASPARGGHSHQPARARCARAALAPRGRAARQRAAHRMRRRRARRGAARAAPGRPGLHRRARGRWPSIVRR